MNDIGRRRIAAMALVLAAFAATTARAADEQKVQIGKFAEATKAMVLAQCNGGRRDAALAAGDLVGTSPAARVGRIFVEESLELTCDCAPRAIDAYVATKGADTFVSLDAAAVEVKDAMGACTARMLRATVQRTCAAGVDPLENIGPTPVDPERLKARCACVQAGMARLSDRQVNEGSDRDDGAWASAPSRHAMKDMEQACRAAHPTR